MTDYPIIELSRHHTWTGRWQAVIRYGPDTHEWCCLSIAFTREGSMKRARWKWKEREKSKAYVPPPIIDRVPL